LLPGEHKDIVLYYKSAKNGIFRNRIVINSQTQGLKEMNSFIQVYGIVNEKFQTEYKDILTNINAVTLPGKKAFADSIIESMIDTINFEDPFE